MLEMSSVVETTKKVAYMFSTLCVDNNAIIVFVCLKGFHESWKSGVRSLSKWAHLARFRTVDKSRLFASIWPNLTSYERHANIQRGANTLDALHLLQLNAIPVL